MSRVLCRRASAVAWVIAFVSCVSWSAWGQSEEDRAAARALATQGVSAYNEGRYGEAFDRFSRAESLLHAPPHVLYLARSAEKLGQLVRARELYLRLVREELPATAPQAFRDAQNQARDEVRLIEPKLASVVIAVTAKEGVVAKVEMDGKPVSTAILGVAIPVDPGKHDFIAKADGYSSAPVTISLAEGGKGTAELVLEPLASKDSGPGSTAPTEPRATTVNLNAPAAASASQKNDRAWMRPATYVAYGVGALGVGASIYFGLDSRGKREDADKAWEACKQTSGGCTRSDVESRRTDSLDRDARRSLNLSLVSAAVGVVGVGAGTAFLLMKPKQESANAASISPWIGFGDVGVSGSF